VNKTGTLLVEVTAKGEDSFLNQFALMLRIAPGVFPLPTPGALFKPVYVGDVADAFVKSLSNRDTFGHTS
jgi:NADH dehydrogenase